MRSLTCLMAAGLLAVASGSAAAAPLAYGEAFDTLYRIDLQTRQAQRIGDAGSYAGQIIGAVSGLTTMSDNALVAVADGRKLLIEVAPNSGAADVLGDLGLSGQGVGQFDALDLNMTANCDDTLWLVSANTQKLWTVDPLSGATTLVGNTAHTITGLVSYGDRLYGAGGLGDNRFYSINTATGVATPIGNFGPAVTHWVNSVSMGFDENGILWAVLNYVPPESDNDTPVDWSDLATIDPATGRVTVLGPITGPEALRQIGMRGFTVGPAQCGNGAGVPQVAPIGSPWALLLLGVLLAAAVAWHLRAMRF